MAIKIPSKKKDPVQLMEPKPQKPAPVSKELKKLVKATKETPVEEADANTEHPLLEGEDLIIEPVTDLASRLRNIEKLIALDEMETLKSGLKDVMLYIKANPDIVIELEPKDIGLIVQGYIKGAKTETKAILTKKKKVAKKRTSKKKAAARVKALEAAADINLNEVDF